MINFTDFVGFDMAPGPLKELKEALIDRTIFLKEINKWQIYKGTYSVFTDIHRSLNSYKDAIAGKTFGLKARQQNFIRRIKEEGKNGQDFGAKDVGIWAALNKRETDVQLGKPNVTGISDASASRERARLLPFKAKLDSLVKAITDNHREALEIRKVLLTKEQYEERLKNPDFVELREYDNAALQGRLEHAVPGVYGLNIAGQEYKAQGTRTGEPKYEDIIAYSFVDIEQAHMRTSWNDVALTIARFAIASPGNGMVEFHPATKITVRNEITGLDEVRHERPALDKEYINFTNKGIPYTIKMTNDRFITAVNSISKEKNWFEKLKATRARQDIGAKGWGIIVAIAAILILIFHPWPHFQWAAYNDNVSSYDGFVARFPQSDYSAVAYERIRVLREDEIWSNTDGSDQIETLRAYLRVYPDGKHLDEAKQQTTRIADNQWIPISKSRSEAEISHYLEDFPETSKRAAVEARIQELYNDIDWVKEQDTLEHYRRFATRFPTHSQSRAIDKRIIDLEVKEIAAGEYGEMPRAQALSQGGTSTNVEVENQTGYELTVRYSGPDSKKLVIPIGATRSIKLVPGAYQVAASVDAANVTNYYGSDTMQGGRYSSNFYIE